MIAKRQAVINPGNTFSCENDLLGQKKVKFEEAKQLPYW
jgi:hypothetical protein